MLGLDAGENMRPIHAMKSLYRSPVRTILTFILLSVVTFELFTQAAEYAVTAREITNAAGQYRGVGAVEAEAPNMASPLDSYSAEAEGEYVRQYRTLTQEQVDAVSALPYIDSADTRYMTAGISSEYRRLPERDALSNYLGRSIIEGTLSFINDEFAFLVLEDSALLAGDLPLRFVEKYIYVGYSADGLGSNGYGNKYMLSEMTVGERYVFVVQGDERSFRESSRVTLAPNTAQAWCPAIQHVESGAADYLGRDEYEPLRTLIEITDSDKRTFDMVYTCDMSAIMRFAKGDMAIWNGRVLTPEDDESGARVCVVSKEFASINGVSVGDTITMKLGTKLFEQYNGLGALASINPRYEPPGEEVSLEVVGVYTDTDEWSKRKTERNWSYSINTVFVPGSLLPVDRSSLDSHEFTPAEFSFNVADAWDIPAYIKEVAPMLDDMGLNLILSESGWLEIAEDFRQASRLSVIKITVFTAAVVLATAFAAYLFIMRKKKDYAIMRALGKTSKASALTMAIPLFIVTAASVLAGSGAAWRYTVSTIERNNLLVNLEGYAVNTAIPSGIVLACILGEILLTLLLALLLLMRLGAMSPLALLQDSGAARVRVQGQRAVSAQDLGARKQDLVETGDAFSILAITLPPPGAKDNSAGFVVQYVWKHIRRATAKSALTALLALLMVAAVGQFALMKQSYTDLIENTEIVIRFAGGARLSILPKILESGYVRDPYYDVSTYVDFNDSGTALVVTNNMRRFTGEEISVTYADGYDEASAGEIGEIVFVGKDLAEARDIKPGDTVTLRPPFMFQRALAQRFYLYADEYPDLSEEEVREIASKDIAEILANRTDIFTVAGVFASATGDYDSIAFAPGSLESYTLLAIQSVLNVSEYTLDDNMLADEFIDFSRDYIPGVAAERVSFVMDTSKLKNPENILNIMETLKPILIAAALLIGAFLCVLVVLQSSKEAAIMRVLGTRKSTTNAALTLEQALLSFAGIAAGGCGLFAYRRQALAAVSGEIALFGALYFAVVFAAAAAAAYFVTRREVLALLQTKE